MAFEAKALFMKDLEREFFDILTASDMAKTLSIISEQLSSYDMNRLSYDDRREDDLLEIYLSALTVEGRSKATINRYRYIIGRMIDSTGVGSRSMTIYHLRKYLSDEKSRGISDRTLESTRQVFSAYFNWLQREGLIQSNPTANLGSIKFKKKVKQIYSDMEIERLKIECTNIRDKAIISFLLSTGCRISEMLNLNRDDIDFNSLECKVVGKGNKERTVYIDAVTAMYVKEYIFSRSDYDKSLFLNSRGARLTASGVRIVLRKLAKKCGMDDVYPHKFRRTLATNLIRHGMPIQEVAAILGHDKLDTTMQYVILDNTDVKNAYRKFA